jgi:hypothetical protein
MTMTSLAARGLVVEESLDGSGSDEALAPDPCARDSAKPAKPLDDRRLDRAKALQLS